MGGSHHASKDKRQQDKAAAIASMLQASIAAGDSSLDAGDQPRDIMRAELAVLKSQKRRAPPEETLAALTALQHRVRAASCEPASRTLSQASTSAVGLDHVVSASQRDCGRLPEIKARRRALSAPLYSRTTDLRLPAL